MENAPEVTKIHSFTLLFIEYIIIEHLVLSLQFPALMKLMLW